MTSLNNAFASAKRPSSRKGTSKDKSSSKKSGASKGLSGDADTGYAGLTAQQAAAGATGFTLDTNMDEMEGIVSQDTLNSSTSNTGFLNDRAFHHRPSTPDSITAATLARRRGSLAPSYMTYSRDSSSRKDSEMGFDGESSAPSSPLREEPFRRPSLAVDGTSIWQPGFNFTTATNASQNQGIGIALEESRPPSGGPAPTRGSATRTSAGMQGAAAANAAARAAHAQQHHQQQQLAALQQSQAIDANLNPEAGWTAPESWAVEEMTQDGEDADASDEDGQALGASPISGGLSPMLLPGEERRESNGGRRTSLVPGRPGTSGSMGGASSLKGPNVSFHLAKILPLPCLRLTGFSGGQRQYALRIFKPDNTFTTLMIPISVPVSEVMYMVSRKPGFVNQSGRHLLYLREKGAGTFGVHSLSRASSALTESFLAFRASHGHQRKTCAVAAAAIRAGRVQRMGQARRSWSGGSLLYGQVCIQTRRRATSWFGACSSYGHPSRLVQAVCSDAGNVLYIRRTISDQIRSNTLICATEGSSTFPSSFTTTRTMSSA